MEFNHQHVYLGKCRDPNYDGIYFIGETAWRVSERIFEYSGRDNKSHSFKNANEREHKNVERQVLK